MYDAIILAAHGKVLYAKLLTILCQSLHLFASNRVMDSILLVAGCVMVGHSHHPLWAEYLEPLVSECVKCLRTGYLMGIESVYIELCGAVGHVLHHMCIPYLVEECIHTLNLFIQSIYASTEAVTISVLAPKP